jgi:hypothetical protein
MTSWTMAGAVVPPPSTLLWPCDAGAVDLRARGRVQAPSSFRAILARSTAAQRVSWSAAQQLGGLAITSIRSRRVKRAETGGEEADGGRLHPGLDPGAG